MDPVGEVLVVCIMGVFICDFVCTISLVWCMSDLFLFFFLCRGQYDIIIGSDLVYTKKMVRPLLNTIKSLLKPGGTVFFVSAETDRVRERERGRVSAKAC